MRETRLYDFATVQEEQQFEIVNVSVSRNNVKPQESQSRSWAGIVANTIAWRVEEGCILIFEHIITRKGLKIVLSSSLSSKPFFLSIPNSSEDTINFLLPCYTAPSGCTLLCMRVDKSLEISFGNSACEEFARTNISTAVITAATNVDGDTIVGLSSGACGIVDIEEEPLRRISVRPFDTSLSRKGAIENINESGSVASFGSDVASSRSARSTRSFRIMSRLFGSPQTAGTTTEMVHGTGNSVDVSQLVLSSQAKGKDKGYGTGPGDIILAVVKIDMDSKSFATLHASGRVCAYMSAENSYRFISDIVLPVKLSSRAQEHFLISGTANSVIAVVLADEDPGADSLRVFNITARSTFRHIVLSCTQIAKREGPVGQIVSAVFCANNVIVGTEEGFLAGLLNVESEIDTGSGIPTDTLWTITDDLTKPYGISKAYTQLFTNPKERLSLAHTFSSYALARALRLPSPEVCTRTDIFNAINAISEEEWAEGKQDRIRTRAEEISKLQESRIRGISIIEGGAAVVVRAKKVTILRGLFDSEKSLSQRFGRHFSEYFPVLKGELAYVLSSHAVCQDLTCQILNTQGNESLRNKLMFMLTIATKFSERLVDTPLMDVIMRRRLSKTSSFLSDLSFSEVVQAVLSSLGPGSALLQTLFAISETTTLGVAADRAGDLLPISSMFSRALAWLAKYRSVATKNRDENMMNTGNENTSNAQIDLKTLQDRAYGFFITAARWCDADEGNREEDVTCVMTLAGLSPGVSQTTTDDEMSSPFTLSKLPANLTTADIRKNIAFWLLERSVRLFQNTNIPRNAAAVALEAMRRAPDRERLEMMRAAAFSKFLDAGDLEAALAAILHRPFTGGETFVMKEDESGALRDSLNLFVNAVADAGELQWLATRELPEPLPAMCGHALERRARAEDAFKCVDNTEKDYEMERETENEKQKPEPCDNYKLLYCWQLLRGDEAGAATAALEWAGRLSKEGLTTVRTFSNESSRQLTFEQQIQTLLQWTKAKSTALTYAMSGARMQPLRRQYIARSRFSVLSDKSASAVVDISWVSRRQLLAHAQTRCLKKLLSEGNASGQSTQILHYLSASGSPFLSEQREGVSWAVSTLMQYPSYDDTLLCAELGIAWSAEIGDGVLSEVVRAAASLASRMEVEQFNYADLNDLLNAIIRSMDQKRPSSKWYLIAMESGLGTSAGEVSCPQWLLEAAAWGKVAFDSNQIVEKRFAGRRQGDAVGVVRVFLRNNRPVDAAKVLISGLEYMQQNGLSSGCEYVPFAAIDATVETLSQLADEFPDAARYRQRLIDLTTKYMDRVKEESERVSAEPVLKPSRINPKTTNSAMEVIAV